ncbi:MAG: hypothetical protein FJW35_03980 [Acidobacteria bacterium]|nr:hypothetical protein [Acidobacteriota bacterium]
MKPWWIEFHHNGKRIVEYRKSWQTATEKVGLVGRIPHDFRRTAVRNLERAGVPRTVAMKLVGHKTESIYRRFAIVARQDLVDGLKRLADYRHVVQGRHCHAGGFDQPRQGCLIVAPAVMVPENEVRARGPLWGASDPWREVRPKPVELGATGDS